MATVRPFNGIRYDPTRVPNLADVTCPPYDVISPSDRDQLYERHPYNVVRVVSGKETLGDDPGDNKYERACEFFRSWLWEGVLREDPDPALYIYRQTFSDPRGGMRRIWGLLATIALTDEILAHERTMPGPKEDRLSLMKAVPANLSPIYALYREEAGSISARLPDASHDASVADFVDDEGTRHTVWASHDVSFHDDVARALEPSPLLIADGHHRFETAKLYRDLRSDGGAGPSDHPWDHTMALLVDAGTQPACILPYHRIVRKLVERGGDDLLSVLRRRFDVVDLGASEDVDIHSLEAQLWDAHAFVCFTAGDAYRMVPTDRTDRDVPAGILKRLALDPLGVGPAEEALSFTPHAEVVREAVVSGEARAGFLIPPVTVDVVWDLAVSGTRMPEKSTYFYPKPRDGIVIRALEPCGPPAKQT